jgi:hypothetical protein
VERVIANLNRFSFFYTHCIKNTNKAVYLLNLQSCLKSFNKHAGRVLSVRSKAFKPNKTLLLIY